MRLAALVLVACGSKDPTPPPASLGTVRPLARVQPTSKLVVGTQRVAIVADEGYYEPGSPVSLRGTLSDELAKLRPVNDLVLATHLIAVSGEEHHEKYVRLTPAPREIVLDGHLVRAVALSSGAEVWHYEEKLRAELAVVDADGKVTTLPQLALVGPPLDTQSTVRAKQCSTPQIVGLAADGEAAIAAVVECHPDAPIRLVTYRPGAAVTEQRLASKDVGFVPTHIVAAGDRRALVGVTETKRLAIYRKSMDRRETLDGTTRVIGAAMAGDGAVWTVTIGAGDTWQLARDGVVQALADPSGTPMKPVQVGYDARHGVVAIASNPSSVWLFGER